MIVTLNWFDTASMILVLFPPSFVSSVESDQLASLNDLYIMQQTMSGSNGQWLSGRVLDFGSKGH